MNTKRILFFLPRKFTVQATLIFIVLSFGFVAYLLNVQIQLLNSELNNLISLIKSLESLQEDLQNQILVKDQQIKFLENVLVELHFKLSSFSAYENHMIQNLELLKNEITEINHNEMIQFFKKIGGLVISAFLVFVITKSFSTPVFRDNFEFALVDSSNELIWFIKIIDNKKADIFIKNFNSEKYEHMEQLVKTLIVKSSDSISPESLEQLELISSYIPIDERVITVTQIAEIIGSFFGF